MHDDIETLGTAVIDGVPAAPPVEGVHRRLAARHRRRARGLAAAVAVAALGLGGLALAQGGGEPTTAVAAEGGEQVEPAASPPDEPVDPQGSVLVGDGEQEFGSVPREELAASASRVADRGIEIFGGRTPETEEDRAVVRALMVLEAVPVTDEAGQVVGYWAKSFIPADQYPAEVDQANRTIEAFTG